MRRSKTPAEERLWQALRRKSLGVRARFQHIIVGFFVDFYLPSKRLAIEVDGDLHDLQVEDDAQRSDALGREGIAVLRVRNDDVLTDTMSVLRRIEEHMRCR